MKMLAYLQMQRNVNFTQGFISIRNFDVHLLILMNNFLVENSKEIVHFSSEVL